MRSVETEGYTRAALAAAERPAEANRSLALAAGKPETPASDALHPAASVSERFAPPVCAPGLHFVPGRMCIPDPPPPTPEETLAAVSAVADTLAKENATEIVQHVARYCGWNAEDPECRALSAKMHAFPFGEDTRGYLAYAAAVDAMRLTDPTLKRDARAWARMTRDMALFPERMEKVLRDGR
jgi:hypothetical protein